MPKRSLETTIGLYNPIKKAKYIAQKGYDNFVYIDSGVPFSVSEFTPLDQIDNKFNELYDAGILKYKNTPDVQVLGTPHINLYTYPIGGRLYPFTGHSELQGPNFTVDRLSDTPGYNLLTNNCSTSTYKALKQIFGNDFDYASGSVWRPIDLPVNVERLAKKIPGAKTYKEKDRRRVSIPITKKYINNFIKARNNSLYGLGYEGYATR